MGRHRASGRLQRPSLRKTIGVSLGWRQGFSSTRSGVQGLGPMPASSSLCLVLQGKYFFEIKQKAKENTDFDRDLL